MFDAVIHKSNARKRRWRAVKCRKHCESMLLDSGGKCGNREAAGDRLLPLKAFSCMVAGASIYSCCKLLSYHLVPRFTKRRPWLRSRAIFRLQEKRANGFQVAKMDTRRRQEAVLCGDVLRACTCTNFVYQDSALFGAKAPTRTIVMYGADKQKWTQVSPPPPSIC